MMNLESFIPSSVPTASGMLSFYGACLRALHLMEARKPSGRRFGPNADATWRAFQGHMQTRERMDLLLRDASVMYPTGFGATSVFFHMPPASEDEPFGAFWPKLDGVSAEDIWRDNQHRECATPFDSLSYCAEAWGLKLQAQPIGAVSPSMRIVAVGPSAVASLAGVFAGSRDLDWAEQVVCVATRPDHRHIAGLAAVILDSGKQSCLVGRGYWPPSIDSLRRTVGLVIGLDADPDDLSWVRRILADLRRRELEHSALLQARDLLRRSICAGCRRGDCSACVTIRGIDAAIASAAEGRGDD